MPEIAAKSPPYKCGKCGSRGLWRDDDRLNNSSYIVCRICGNRYPGGNKPVFVEQIPASAESGVMSALEFAPEAVAQGILEQEETRVGMGDKMRKKKEPKTGTCPNCARSDMKLGSHDLCATCLQATVGRTGEAREKALAAAKEKIQIKAAKPDDRSPESVDNSLLSDKTEKGDAEPAAGFSELKNAATKLLNAMKQGIGPIVIPISNQDMIEEVNRKIPQITIFFGPDDRPLYEYLVQEAKDKYRDPDQQILYMIKCNRQADLEAGTSGDGNK
jgi:DNA-directed RNA polymerase subunit RPC12/RpoP